jgi:formylmethanofuran dehydrogenase subunit B
MFWASDPAKTHPRHFAKYSLEPRGMFVPNGRRDRTCVVVDSRKTKTAEEADLFVRIEPGKDFEALSALRALALGVELDAQRVERATGQPMSLWRELMGRMKAARFGAVFFGVDVAGRLASSEALLALARDMNRHARCVCLPNHGAGNAAGADNVVAWRTGFPFAVNLARGYPRFNPGEYTAADLLARRETDAALIVASDPMASLSQPACERLRAIPYAALDPRETLTTRLATVAFTVAPHGLSAGGTVFRMDGVPIPLRPALPSPYPSDWEILTAIQQRVKTLRADAAPRRAAAS